MRRFLKMAAVKSSLGANLSRPNPRGQLVDGLRRQLGRWEAAGAAEDAAVFSCGAAAVDRLLPGGGLRHGMLVEWLAESNSEGESPSSKAPPPDLLPAGERVRRRSVCSVRAKHVEKVARWW